MEHPRYLALPRRLMFSHNWVSYLRALHRVAVDGIDLVHAHCAYPDGLAAVEFARIRGIPSVITVHGMDVRELPNANPRWRKLVVNGLTQATAVIANGRELRQRVLDLGVAEEKVNVIPNGVDCQLFQPMPSARAEKQSWDLLYVGRFSEKKGLRVLLDAMSIIVGQRQDVRLRLVGGSAATGSVEAFQARSHELGLQGFVEFHDEVPWAQIPQHMARAEAVVLPSFYESFGLVLVEAMACGLPVIATRCGGPEAIVDEVSGILVDVGDPPDLARGIVELIDRYASYDRELIRSQTQERYDYETLAGQIFRVYEQAAETVRAF